jgi:SAM-dependent MidA family methyltransferase
VGGAFATAPTLHPAFATAVAAEVAGAGTIVEVGPGDGSLAAAIGAEVLIEPALGMRVRQARHNPSARFVAAASELEPFSGAIVANEVLDALPFRLVEGGREVWVGLDGDGRFRRDHRESELGLPDRGRFVVRPGLADFVTELVRPLAAGLVVLIDYGADGPGDGRRDPVRTYIAGQPGGDALQAPGTQDLTADVDFAVVRDALLAAGLTVVFDGTQPDWLRRHGVRLPRIEQRTDEDWRLARLLDDRLTWRVLVAQR